GRFAKLGVVASMQPYHLADDGRWAEKLIGPKRAKTTYAFRSLLNANVVLAFGSDWFVAPPNVMEGIWAAVTRQTLDGKHPNGWVPEEKITVEEALRAYTFGGAYAGYEESYKGKLAANYLADFVMLDRDITKIPPATIRDAKVVQTWVGGKLAYEAKQ
ncbi:MAG: amidohydrolase family protein, partial [Bryobacterales bacterium]|nr:amidohydrolase family protein [Bryobacterales bacterium]